jgi:hypothetical protein
MTALLDAAPGVRIQFALWGYAMTGDICETAARIAEGQLPDEHHWDRSAADLSGEMVAHGDEPYRQVKDFAALPWAAEHVIRGHEAWPGL